MSMKPVFGFHIHLDHNDGTNTLPFSTLRVALASLFHRSGLATEALDTEIHIQRSAILSSLF